MSKLHDIVSHCEAKFFSHFPHLSSSFSHLLMSSFFLSLQLFCARDGNLWPQNDLFPLKWIEFGQWIGAVSKIFSGLSIWFKLRGKLMSWFRMIYVPFWVTIAIFRPMLAQYKVSLYFYFSLYFESIQRKLFVFWLNDIAWQQWLSVLVEFNFLHKLYFSER